jgi:hypothetical protein
VPFVPFVVEVLSKSSSKPSTSVTVHLLASSIGRNMEMSIDKNKIKTQDELDEPAPMDQAEQRAEAEMKKLEGQAKKAVAEGLRNQEVEEEDKEK